MRLTVRGHDEEQRCKGSVFFLLHCHWLLAGSPVVGSIVFLDLYCGPFCNAKKKKKVKNYKEWSAKKEC